MEKPNVILLTIDTLRADRLGCYGRQPSQTPNLDQLAQSGVRFSQAITGGSWTQAAFPVMLTSTYASMYGGCLGALSLERPSPIAALAQAGYHTAGFSTSPLLSRAYGYQRGFNQFTDLLPNEKETPLRRLKGGQTLLRHPATHAAAKLFGQRTRPAKLYSSAQELTTAVTDWIGQKQTPFFVWAHYMDVHWPYHLEDQLTRPADIAQAWRDLAQLHEVNWHNAPLTPEEKARYVALYERSVAYTDSQIGRLLAYLAQSGLAANTIILVVADHGEEFMEHDRWGHWENNLHDEILRVPFIVHLPNHGRAQVVEEQVRLLDLMPTVLDLCGCPAPSGLEGESVRPLWTENRVPKARIAVSEMAREEWHIISVRTETHKYIWDSHQPDKPRLYDLVADPRERRNVATGYPQIVRDLQAHVDVRLQKQKETKPQVTAVAPDMDDELMTRLRGLGYVE